MLRLIDVLQELHSTPRQTGGVAFRGPARVRCTGRGMLVMVGRYCVGDGRPRGGRWWPGNPKCFYVCKRGVGMRVDAVVQRVLRLVI